MTYARPTKAVIAAAGFGTRFLPQTKAMPKEMLPIVDKPIIQYVVEELVEAGIKDIIIVTGYSKRAIEDHFDTPNAELTAVLQKGGKEHMLDPLHEIADMANFVFVRQKEALGNAGPLLYASHLINDEPFVYMWADEFFLGSPNRMSQAISVYEKTGGTVFSCISVSEDRDFDRFGIIGGEEIEPGVFRMSKVAEKPGKANAPSNLASVGGYILTPDILSYIERIAQEFDGNGELTIQTAMQLMLDDGLPFYAHEIKDSRYYDAGDKVDYLKTVVEIALQHEDIGEEFRNFLKKRLED
ncbi:MAG TPA: UTP--glucose-1-phosphate uridylyltransferase [Candidatus Pristimantibacillus sp.]|nr:UTP--glucose-1-phosphate uridylyltransferase [Candidatus Pristimantibacillus sp.]